MFRIMIIIATVFGATSAAQGQNKGAAQAIDSLVNHYLVRGAVSSWQPYVLFRGCPVLKQWQNRGIDLLMSAALSAERADDLAIAWMFPLKDCNNGRLEDWYFAQFSARIRSGEVDRMLGMWTALSYADSPRIRDYLRKLMLDTSVPLSTRNAAGAHLFEKLTANQRMDEYLNALATNTMPEGVAWGQTDRLLEQNPDQLLRAVGNILRSNPALGDQAAFVQLVHSSVRHATPAARWALGEDLLAGLRTAGGSIDERRRERLDLAIRSLMQPEK